MILTIDTAQLENMLVGAGVLFGAIIGAIYKICKNFGITWSIIKTKLLVNYDAAKLIKHQDDEMVLSKLGLSDELVNFLQEFAPTDDGTINEDVVMSSIKTCNIIIKNRNQNKKLKLLEMKQ